MSSEFEQLRQDILDGKFPSGKLPSMEKLAEQLEVGVSRVRTIVHQLAQEGLVTVKDKSGIYIAKARAVGLLLAEGARWYVGALVGGVSDACFRFGWSLQVAEVGDPEREEEVLKRLLESTDVVLFVPRRGPQTRATADLLREHNDQIIFLDRHPESGEFTIPVVSADNQRGGELAAEFFLGKDGEIRRLFLISEFEGSAVRERIEGFLNRIARAERERQPLSNTTVPAVNPSRCYRSAFLGRLAGYDAFQRFDKDGSAKSLSGSDGIFATTDAVACGFLQALQEARAKDPAGYPHADDVQILGYDGEEFLHMLAKPFATVVQDFRLIGRKAVEVADSRLRGEKVQPVYRIAVRLANSHAPSFTRKELAAVRQLEWVKANERKLLKQLLEQAPFYVRFSDGAQNRALPASPLERDKALRQAGLLRFKVDPSTESGVELWLPSIGQEATPQERGIVEDQLSEFRKKYLPCSDEEFAIRFFQLPADIAFSVKGRTDKLLWANPAALHLVSAQSLASLQGLPPGDIWAADDSAKIAEQDAALLEQTDESRRCVRVYCPSLSAHIRSAQNSLAYRISVRYLFGCPVVDSGGEAGLGQEGSAFENLMLGVTSYWLGEGV